VPRKPGPRRIARLAVVAGAAAALAIALVSYRVVTATPPLDPLRAAPAPRPEAIAPIGRLERPPQAFTWKAMAGARAHRVELLDASGSPVWSSMDVSGTSVPWPAELSARRGSYFWQVVAVPGNVASPLVDFTF
jgi:hypothetical protein